MVFEIEKITGFSCSQTEVRIYDSKGRPFYFFDNYKKNHRFNLPSGCYVTDNIIKKRSIVKYKKVKLPKKERNFPFPKNIDIIFSMNPNKCSIYYKKDGSEAKIIFDPSFKNMPYYILIFVVYHELGHMYYASEEGADAYAFNCMLKRGFNISQAMTAIEATLSDTSIYRINEIIKRGSLTKIK